jgi:phage N-6-adenine-methyltransferase
VKSGVHRLQACFSSATDEWPTPPSLFDALHREFGFTLDPCATVKNAKCRRFFSRTDDGLVQDWAGETVFMNPPYGRVIGQWMAKAHETSLDGTTVVCLVPARTDARWWHLHVMRAAEIRFLRGRITFEGGKHPAPFPSAIVVFRQSKPALVSSSVHRGS